MLIDLELGKNSMNDWEKRGTIPSGEVIIKIAEYFNVSTDYLLGITNNPALNRTEATEEEKIAAKIFTLTADQRRIVEKYIDFIQPRQG